MSDQYTFNDLIIETFNIIKEPMSAKEIWDKAEELKLDKKLGSKGITPWDTVSARLYTNIKEEQDKSIFIKVSKRPTKFILRSLYTNPESTKGTIERQIIKYEEIEKNIKYSERELHPLLSKYVFTNPHFNCYVKTIYHENSSKKAKGANEWLHPDLVGVYFPFNDYSKETRELQSSLSVSAIKLFAFEMKINLKFSNIRQYFFQAVSNSSWANEGYLVCLKMDEDPEFKNELQRLSNSFGIGVIKLNAEIINESEIIFPALYKNYVDWDTVNRLAEESPDFRRFISDLIEDLKIGKIKSNYDKVYDDKKYEEYIKDKKII
jgi:hypothetical protein